MDGALYDDFGNYIGPDSGSDSESDSNLDNGVAAPAPMQVDDADVNERDAGATALVERNEGHQVLYIMA